MREYYGAFKDIGTAERKRIRRRVRNSVLKWMLFWFGLAALGLLVSYPHILTEFVR